MALCIILRHHKLCACIHQIALLFSHLRHLNNAVSSQIYKKYNWQCATVELATYMHRSCRGVLGRAKSATACITSLCAVGENKLADFNLAVSTPTTKPPNLIPCQIFSLYSMCMYVCMYVRMYVCMYVCMYVRMYVCCIYMYVCVFIWTY